MPQFDITTEEKIALLRGLYRLGTQPQAYELVRITWPSPDGVKWYSTMPLDEAVSPPPRDENDDLITPIEVRIIAESQTNYFLPVVMGGAVGDEETTITFWDGDGVMSDLLADHGEGMRGDIYYWFPQVELLLKLWHGHLRLEDEAEPESVDIKFTQGYRSAESTVPHRAKWNECQAIFGGVFDTQAEIDEHRDCPYNRQIVGGLVGNLNSGVPFTSCPRKTQADCSTRLGVNGRYMLSHRASTAVVANGQTTGPQQFSISEGGQTIQKEPVRVVMGQRRVRNMKVLNFAKDVNNNNPGDGWFRATYEGVEGPIGLFWNVLISVNNTLQSAQAIHYQYRQGNSPEIPVAGLSNHGFSGTSLIGYTFGRLDPRTVEPNRATASAITDGLTNIRIYSDADTYTTAASTNRAWHLARLLCDKRWGLGYDYAELDIDSFIETADWVAESVRFTDPDGTVWDHVRGRSNIELVEKKVQQHIDDLCISGRISRPFLFNGKIHVMPLKALTAEELAAAPVFTDEGDEPNILGEDLDGVIRTTLKRSRLSDIDLPNRIETKFDDIENDYLESEAQPVEDIDQQLRAGRVIGTAARKLNTKEYALMGVVTRAQAMKMAWTLLDVGPCDEGGMANNLRLKFKIWFVDGLDLHPYKVIKVNSSLITRYGFEYFRIRPDGLQRTDDLTYEVECQAYPVAYMDALETPLSELPGPPDPPSPPDPPGPVPADPQLPQPEPPFPQTPVFGPVSYVNGFLTIPIEAS